MPIMWNVYSSTPGDPVICIKSTQCVSIHIAVSYLHVNYLPKWYLRGISVSGTYLAIMCGTSVADCIFGTCM